MDNGLLLQLPELTQTIYRDRQGNYLGSSPLHHDIMDV